MIPDFDPSGSLPRGRFCTTPQEIAEKLVKGSDFSSSTTRDKIWDDFLLVVDLIRRKKVKVPAAFVGGGFTTNKVDPGDIDASIIIDISKITNNGTLNAIQNIVQNTKRNGLLVDAFLIQWFPDGSENGLNGNYLFERGKWDDFWQRDVPPSDRSPQQRWHAMPVRGYLEVVLDGYV